MIGSIPIGIVGLLFKDTIETTFRNLWLVGLALILWSGVMYYADVNATLERHEREVSRRDTLIIGIVQCLALVPGVSRSGATMAAGLMRGLDRVTVTRLSFFLAIPALTAATLLEIVSHHGEISTGVGWSGTLIATVTSFFVAYATIAWLLRYVAGHNFSIFIVYRVLIGLLILLLLCHGRRRRDLGGAPHAARPGVASGGAWPCEGTEGGGPARLIGRAGRETPDVGTNSST